MALKEIRTTLSPGDRYYADIFLEANKLDNLGVDYYSVPYKYWTNTYIVFTYDDADMDLVGDIVAISLRHSSLQDAILDFADKCRSVY